MDNNSNYLTELRLQYFPIIWILLLPFRIYLRYFPIQRGKGLILRHIINPILPSKNASYQLELPAGGVVCLKYRETLGISSLIYGTFESSELNFVSRFLSQGSSAFDIGANVGIFTVTMGIAVGETGKVISFEPVPSNIDRLNENIEINHLRNVEVRSVALGNIGGDLKINLAEDAAYHSLGPVEKPFKAVETITIPVRRLDDIWSELGEFKIDLIKIDVEGAESDVLYGAELFLKKCRPVILIEANTEKYLKKLSHQLESFGYVCLKPPNFVTQNFLFHTIENKDAVLKALK